MRKRSNVQESTTLMSPMDLKNELPISEKNIKFINESRDAISRIICGNDKRILLIIGPCSIHDINSAKEYAKLLKSLIEKTRDEFFIVMRVYCEKPRTKVGWKGMLYDPHLDDSGQLETGMKLTRMLMLEITEMGIPIATELVDPLFSFYFDDLISWVCIGARTSSSQTHRQIVSGLPCPVAFKNDCNGNIHNAIMSVMAADTPHHFIGIDEHGRVAKHLTSGNPFGHIVLRGGKNKTNYDRKSIDEAAALLEKEGLISRVIVDCAHENCNKDINKMHAAFQSVIEQIISGNDMVSGLMLESNIEKGNQPMSASDLKFGVSITDPCINWETTEDLVLWAKNAIRQASEQKSQ